MHKRAAMAFSATALACAALTACGSGSSETPAETVTVTQQAPANRATPAEVESATPVDAALPADAAGTNAQALDDELRGIGFQNIVYNSTDGRTVLWLANWTVTSLEGAGTTVPTDHTIVVHVIKP